MPENGQRDKNFWLKVISENLLMLKSETQNALSYLVYKDLPMKLIMDVDDFINAEESVHPGGIMSTEEIVANVRGSQIDELGENQEPNVTEPNVSTEVALDALYKLKIYIEQSINLDFNNILNLNKLKDSILWEREKKKRAFIFIDLD